MQPDTPFLQVACGSFHTILRRSDGNIFTCGSGSCGQLGQGNCQDQADLLIVDALNGKGCRAVSAGGEMTAVLTSRAWVDDHEAKECMSCKLQFTFVNRKHHCKYIAYIRMF